MQFNPRESVNEINNQYAEALQDLYYGIDVSNSVGIISSRNDSIRKAQTEEITEVFRKISFDLNEKIQSYQYKKEILSKLEYFYCYGDITIIKDEQGYTINCVIDNPKHNFTGSVNTFNNGIIIQTKDSCNDCEINQTISQCKNKINVRKTKSNNLVKEFNDVKEEKTKVFRIIFGNQNQQLKVQCTTINRVIKDGIILSEDKTIELMKRCPLDESSILIKETKINSDITKDEINNTINCYIAKNNCPSYVLLQPDKTRAPITKNQYTKILKGALSPNPFIEAEEEAIRKRFTT